MKLAAIILPLATGLKAHANSAQAEAMSKYMRNLFPYYGLKTPVRRNVAQPWIRKIADENERWNHDLIKELWSLPEREYQYVAVDLLVRMKSKVHVDDLSLIEYIVDNKSWWDTVDLVASHLVGELIIKSPELKETTLKAWATDKSSSIWLRRTAILAQLKFKKKIDTELLSICIKNNMNTSEFFLNKAIGWILREYSKTNKAWVTTFLRSHPELNPLSVREASKYLSKGRI